ncbi:FecR domain-containing protein [Pseudomonas sp. OHS18]|uniref:FecR domain-containing protein n=1 Tax=Pseudomonas sp. OHS18 TaxID=3399679 RepID=UPI003A84D7C1
MAPEHVHLQQAAEWFAVLADPPVSDQQRQAWQQWLAARPEHAAAWQRVEAISSQFARLPAATHRRAAAQALRHSGRSRRQVLGLFAVLGGAGLLAAAGQGMPLQAWLASERTGTGQIRDVRLADGSHLWLGSRTAVDIDYSASTRLLRLLQGEVLIDTAVDPRPLLLDTRHGRLQALGTRFSVREGNDFSQLSVFAGAVRIEPSRGRAGQVLQAGHQVRFGTDGISASAPADPARQAWSRGVLLANDRPLGISSRSWPITCRVTWAVTRGWPICAWSVPIRWATPSAFSRPWQAACRFASIGGCRGG